MRAFDEAGCVEVVSEPRLVGALNWQARQGQVTCPGSPRVRTSKGQIVRTRGIIPGPNSPWITATVLESGNFPACAHATLCTGGYGNGGLGKQVGGLTISLGR